MGKAIWRMLQSSDSSHCLHAQRGQVNMIYQQGQVAVAGLEVESLHVWGPQQLPNDTISNTNSVWQGAWLLSSRIE